MVYPSSTNRSFRTCAAPLMGTKIMHPEAESAATKSWGSPSLGTILSFTHWATFSCPLFERRAQKGSRHIVVRSARNLRTNEHSFCNKVCAVGRKWRRTEERALSVKLWVCSAMFIVLIGGLSWVTAVTDSNPAVIMG